jgi:hypothetical protein
MTGRILHGAQKQGGAKMDVPFIWQCQPKFDWEYAKNKKNIIYYYFWLTGLVCKTIERTPLCLLSAGFWYGLFFHYAVKISDKANSGNLDKGYANTMLTLLNRAMWLFLILDCIIVAIFIFGGLAILIHQSYILSFIAAISFSGLMVDLTTGGIIRVNHAIRLSGDEKLIKSIDTSFTKLLIQ